MPRYLLHHLLEASAQAHPGAIAVIDRDRRLSYAELDAWSNRLARVLGDLGVRLGDRVGLYLDKSLESLVAIYGILKAGAAYVPLDPQAPPSRLGFITGNCGIRILVTSAQKESAWDEIVAAGSVENLVLLQEAEPTQAPANVKVVPLAAVLGEDPSPPDVAQIDLDLAYILYTSGSTGTPKGVMLTHLNALAFVNWAVEAFGVQAEDRLSSHAPLHFDLSVFDLFAAASAGATVVLVPPKKAMFPAEVANFIRSNAITVWYSVPSALSLMTLRGGVGPGDFPRLRTILFAGEVFPTKYLRRLMQLLPHVRFCNLYGPTETNVCTWYEVPALPEEMTEPIPIGRSIAGVEAFVVADDGSRAAPGQMGELYVRGSTVMQGYWGDPERSARGLVPPPPISGLHDLAYRTGDMVIQQPDGMFRFLGRRDGQIKSRGYRIELGEIETALYGHPAVTECAVTVIPDELVTNRIKAHVVVRDRVSEGELVGFCATVLPRYMIPEIFEFREALPRTSTGKVDRQALVEAATGAR